MCRTQCSCNRAARQAAGGTFTLPDCCASGNHADPDTPAKLPAEEAALYECVRLEVSDVAAYVADGDFDWQAEQGGEVRAGWAASAVV